jgi:diguanylate cyclase (GGDEF)-like protein
MAETNTSENKGNPGGEDTIETHLAYEGQLRKERNNPEFQKEVEIAEKLIDEDSHKAAEMWALDKKNSLTDTLTELPNRRHFEETLKKEISARLRQIKNNEPVTPLSLIFLDTNNLKEVNRFGHNMGDKYLICIKESILQEKRETDFAARFGGDEFTIICENPSIEVDKLAIRTGHTFNMKKQFLKLPDYAGFKYNIAEWDPNTRETMESFVKRADIYQIENQNG